MKRQAWAIIVSLVENMLPGDAIKRGQSGTTSDCKHQSVTAQSQHSHSTVTEGESGTASDCKHQSASEKHGHEKDHTSPGERGVAYSCKMWKPKNK